jgi:transcriptional regulator with XRE-family HTH domain
MALVSTARDLGRVVRQARRTTGLSQQALAGRIGVGRMTVGRLERGEEVSAATVLAAMHVCGVTVLAEDARGWLTAAEHANAIGRELTVGDRVFALRLVRQALEDLDYLIGQNDAPALRRYLAVVPSTADARWDCLLRIAIGSRCTQHGMPSPEWTRAGRLPEPFFPASPGRRFMAQTVSGTDAEFADANIWIDARDLSYA